MLALFAGIFMVLGYAPFNLWPIAPLALATLFYLNHNASNKTAATNGFLFGLGWFGAGISWVHVSIAQFGGLPLIASLLLMLLLVSYLAIYPALACWLTHKFCAKNSLSISYIACFIPLFILMEYLRGTLLTGFPWLSFGYTLTDSPFAALAPWIGEMGLTVVVLLIAYAVFAASKKHFKPIIVWCVIISTALVCAHFASRVSYSDKTIDVVLVQGNIKQELRFAPENFWPTMAKYQDMTRPNWQADLIVWPEAAIPEIEVLVDDYLANLDKAAAFNNTALITGVLDYQLGTKTVYNNLVAVGKKNADDTTGHYHYLHTNRYSKHQLLPIGEFVPFEQLLRPIAPLFNLDHSSFTRGEAKQANLVANGFNVLPAICYEIAFTDLVRGNYTENSDLLFTVSNDAWFGNSHGPHQHMQIARMRALELGLPLIRVTNNGISGVYDPVAKQGQYLPQFEAAVERLKLPLLTGNTFFSQFGNHILYAFLLLSLLLSQVLRYRARNISQ
ncbi:apolipoprotein N-acyltransferase [Pseudoalteromonas sp. SSM20]|uniref:apolipoprotein N-acyltransferase n=1 Tax=Pseudoalteromonas sp. SSM20 TaxID=3139394 RepID=UPI003BACB395